MTRTANAGKALLQILIGILVLVLSRWTPRTAKGILIFAALLIGSVVGIAVLSAAENTGYWPEKPEDRT